MKHLPLLLILTFVSFFASAQMMTIEGVILDEETGEEMIGASVIAYEGDKDYGTYTEFDGTFKLKIPKSIKFFEVSYVGYESQVVKIDPELDSYTIRLKEEGELMEVAVVTSSDYSKSKRRKTRTERRERRDDHIVSPRIRGAKEESKSEILSYGAVISSGSVETETPPSPPPVLAAPGKLDAEPAEMMYDAAEEAEPVMGVDAIAEYSASEPPADLPKAGQLTAGRLDDFNKWNLWQDISEVELDGYKRSWKISPWDRYTVQVATPNGYPVIDATVTLKRKDNVIWETRTDNTGKAELWANIFEDGDGDKFKVEVEYDGQIFKKDRITDFHSGINMIELPVQCKTHEIMDIAFVVDATGSMGDEIQYLKSELKDVISRVKQKSKDKKIRLGSVFYRDFGDEYVTKKTEFDEDINKTVNFIEGQSARGGGDTPEAVDEALRVAIYEMDWSEYADTRLMFLLLDAPPHNNAKTKEKVRLYTKQAAKWGIRIIPVACSGTGHNTEYLMRAIALATNGSYLYLTDDSGIGATHTKPVTDEHKVELLNGLLIETILNFSHVTDCDDQLVELARDTTVSDTMTVILKHQTQDPNQQQPPKEDPFVFQWKYYPNPTPGPLTIELEGKLDVLYLTDMSGKILQRVNIADRRRFELDLRKYPSGVYYLKALGEDGREVNGKVVLVRTY